MTFKFAAIFRFSSVANMRHAAAFHHTKSQIIGLSAPLLRSSRHLSQRSHCVRRVAPDRPLFASGGNRLPLRPSGRSPCLLTACLLTGARTATRISERQLIIGSASLLRTRAPKYASVIDGSLNAVLVPNSGSNHLNRNPIMKLLTLAPVVWTASFPALAR